MDKIWAKLNFWPWPPVARFLQTFALKASSAAIVPSTSFAVKACHSRRKENALSFDQVEQMLFNFVKQKQTRKSNYSTVRLFFLVWSSLNFPSVFFWVIDCVIWLVDWFLVHCRSSFLPLYVNLFCYSVSKCWPNYSEIIDRWRSIR